MSRLIMTVEEMQDREKWLAARKKGIGGSDAAAIVGLSPWKSALSLWAEKTGQAEPENLSDNERVYWGNQLEDLVAREFTKRTGKETRRRGLLANDEFPFLLASVDRLIVGEDAGLECKTSSFGKAWDGDEIPDSYYVQCLHYMLVTGAARWYIAALIGGNRFIWKEIKRDEKDVSALLDAEKDFWRKVEAREMPPVDGSASCTKALSERFRGGLPPVELPDETGGLLVELAELEAAGKRIDAQAEEIKNRLREMLGDAEEGLFRQGEELRRVLWKTQAGRVTVDGKRLKAEKPEIYAEYVKQGKPFRTFKVV